MPMLTPSDPTLPTGPLLLPPCGAPRPLPDHTICWRICRTRRAAAALLAHLAELRVPVWVSGTRVADGTWTFYVWAPGHNAALLGVLLAVPPHHATIVSAESLPDAPWWACGRALIRLLGPAEVAP